MKALRLMTLLLLLVSPGARAKEEKTLQSLLSFEAFKDLAVELAPKVTLFRKIWEEDRQALVFGGTSRDYLFWLRRQFRGVKSQKEMDDKVAALKALKTIDLKEFILPGSDADVMSDKKLTIDAKAFELTRLDTRSKDAMSPTTKEGQSERKQGWLPMEKIVLAADKLWTYPGMGDGVREIYEGKPTLVLTPRAEFDKTYYASIGQNHQVLLALRYLRLVSMCYFSEKGQTAPDIPTLLEVLDPSSARQARDVFEQTRRDPKFHQLLNNAYFLKRVNGTLHKGFGTFTSPTATHELYRQLGAERMVEAFEEIQPINQYLFHRETDPAAIERKLSEYGVDPEAFFEHPGKFFPNGYLYHGTPTEDSFRRILTAGVLPSRAGAAGEGLYGVGSPELSIAVSYGKKGFRTVRFPVLESARVVDITQGEGRRIFKEFKKRNKGKFIDAFAEEFGIDIVRYPFHPEDAYVVKNAAALGEPSGHTRQVATFGQLLKLAEEAGDEKKAAQALSGIAKAHAELGDTVHLLEHTAFLEHLASDPSPEAGLELVRLVRGAEVDVASFVHYLKRRKPAAALSLMEPWMAVAMSEGKKFFPTPPDPLLILAADLMSLPRVPAGPDEPAQQASDERARARTIESLHRFYWYVLREPPGKLSRRERAKRRDLLIKAAATMVPPQVGRNALGDFLRSAVDLEAALKKELAAQLDEPILSVRLITQVVSSAGALFGGVGVAFHAPVFGWAPVIAQVLNGIFLGVASIDLKAAKLSQPALLARWGVWRDGMPRRKIVPPLTLREMAALTDGIRREVAKIRGNAPPPPTLTDVPRLTCPIVLARLARHLSVTAALAALSAAESLISLRQWYSSPYEHDYPIDHRWTNDTTTVVKILSLKARSAPDRTNVELEVQAEVPPHAGDPAITMTVVRPIFIVKLPGRDDSFYSVERQGKDVVLIGHSKTVQPIVLGTVDEKENLTLAPGHYLEGSFQSWLKKETEGPFKGHYTRRTNFFLELRPPPKLGGEKP